MIKAEEILMIKELNYDITKDDLKNYAKDLMNINYYKKQRLLTSAISFIIFAILCFIGLFLNKDINSFIHILIFGLLLPVIFYYLFPEMLKEGTLKVNKGIDFSNNKVKIDSENGTFSALDRNSNSEFKWSNINDVYNLKYSILIFTKPNMAIIIPKRIFENEQEMNETWELIKGCFDKAGKKD